MATTTNPDTRTADIRPAMRGAGTLQLNTLDWIAIILTLIGAINWGLVGLFNFDVIAALFGSMSAVSRVIYVIVGLAGLYQIATAAKLARRAPEATA